MNPGWFLKTRSPSSFIRRNASRPSSEPRSMFHLPMVQRRYIITPPGLLPSCYGHHDNRSLKGGASADACFTEGRGKRLSEKWYEQRSEQRFARGFGGIQRPKWSESTVRRY